jgi:hypothetical protein
MKKDFTRIPIVNRVTHQFSTVEFFVALIYLMSLVVLIWHLLIYY